MSDELQFVAKRRQLKLLSDIKLCGELVSQTRTGECLTTKSVARLPLGKIPSSLKCHNHNPGQRSLLNCRKGTMVAPVINALLAPLIKRKF
jgi:hypothetical protein